MSHQENQVPHENQQKAECEPEPVEQNKHTVEKRCFFFLGDSDTAKNLLQIIQGVYYSIFITVITLVALFADDFRIIFFSPEEDIAFNYVSIVCMFFFLIEILILSFIKEQYFLSFYFFIDIISTGTMILDLTWIKQLMTGGNKALQTAATIAKVARASRVSSIGAKATKLIRIVRLIRFLKLYKTASKQLAKQNYLLVAQKGKKIPKQSFSKQSKLSLNKINSKNTNNRWSRFKQDSSCRVIQFKPSNGSIGSMAIQGETNDISARNHNQKKASISNFSNIKIIQHPVLINKKQDQVVESATKLENLTRKKHKTQNLKDLAGFQGLFKEFLNSGTKGDESMRFITDSSTSFQIPKETRVAIKIKDEIQKQLITMILLIIVCIPLFNASTWFSNSTTSYEKGINQLQFAAKTSTQLYDAIDDYYINSMISLPSTLVYFSVNVNKTCCTFPDNYADLRNRFNASNSEEYRIDDLVSYSTDGGSLVVFQTTSTSQLTSKLNIGRTLFVCVILVVSILLFSRDLENHALQPLENMFETVSKIALNPLGAIREIEEKNMCLESMQQKMAMEKEQMTEPNQLSNLIVKIGGLLAVGFGEAGTQIISKVIQDPQFVNVIIPGEKVMGIYGFCDIRNFTDATQILQADVMVFVNEIAEICHSIVNSHCGSPNKNIGDAFLLVWKYKQTDIKFNELKQIEHKKLELVETKRVKQMADLAVLSFVRIIAEISKSETLLKYKNNRALRKRIKDYKGVKMGFGLHVGWSIEGPIGSEYKVDASYLSPSVNMASRLEAGTKDYGVPILITEDVYKLMTQNRQYLRQVDRVMFQGYLKPTNLYTVDLYIDNLIKQVGIYKEPKKSLKQKKYQKIRENIKRNKLLEEIETKFVTKKMWEDRDIKLMREKYTLGFYQEWQKGFDLYIKGEWTEALQVFKRTQIMAPDKVDGPSEALINFINSHEGKPPADWKGYREASF